MFRQMDRQAACHPSPVSSHCAYRQLSKCYSCQSLAKESSTVVSCILHQSQLQSQAQMYPCFHPKNLTSSCESFLTSKRGLTTEKDIRQKYADNCVQMSKVVLLQVFIVEKKVTMLLYCAKVVVTQDVSHLLSRLSFNETLIRQVFNCYL